MACDILRNRVQPGETCEQAVNRLWTAGVSELRPWISNAAVDVYLENWKLERITALAGDAGALAELPQPADDPPIVVRWRNRDCLLDGRRRIDRLAMNQDQGPHTVLILDIGNMAGDI